MRVIRRKAGALDRTAAAVLTVAIAGYWFPAGIFAATGHARSAEIRGHVLSAGGLSGVAGVSVKAAHLETRQVFTSESTGEDGTYTLVDLPPGTYDLAVQTPEGLYAADTLVQAEPGRRSVISLALKPTAAAQSEPQDQPDKEGEQGQEGQKEGEKKADDAKEKEDQPQEQPPEPEPEKKKKKKGSGFWRSPAGAAIAIVVGAGMIGVGANSAIDNDSDNEPPMTQSGSIGDGSLR